MYALCRRPKTAVYTTSVHGSVHDQCTRPKTAVHTVRTLPCTRADTARTRLYTRHVYGRVHVSTCLRVQGRVHGRVRAIYTAENGRIHGRTRPCNVSYTAVYGPYLLVYTGGVDGHGPYTAVYGPCIRRGRYTAMYEPFSWAKTCSRVVYTAAV